MKFITQFFKRLWVLYLQTIGITTAYTIGKIDHYSPVHQRYLISGYACGSCGARLMKKVLLPDIRILDADGYEVPLMKARTKGEKFQCPYCSFSWKFRMVQNAK